MLLFSYRDNYLTTQTPFTERLVFLGLILKSLFFDCKFLLILIIYFWGFFFFRWRDFLMINSNNCNNCKMKVTQILWLKLFIFSLRILKGLSVNLLKHCEYWISFCLFSKGVFDFFVSSFLLIFRICFKFSVFLGANSLWISRKWMLMFISWRAAAPGNLVSVFFLN